MRRGQDSNIWQKCSIYVSFETCWHRAAQQHAECGLQKQEVTYFSVFADVSFRKGGIDRKLASLLRLLCAQAVLCCFTSCRQVAR